MYCNTAIHAKSRRKCYKMNANLFAVSNDIDELVVSLGRLRAVLGVFVEKFSEHPDGPDLKNIECQPEMFQYLADTAEHLLFETWSTARAAESHCSELINDERKAAQSAGEHYGD